LAHVSLVTLGVDDLERATTFYRAMGWERSGASVPGTVTFLRGGAIVLGLYGREDLARDAGVAVTGLAGSARVALAMNVDAEAAVDRALRDAEAAGGTVTRPAARAEWGGYSGYFADPDGHLWEVAHNPGFPLLADGRLRLPDDDRPA